MRIPIVLSDTSVLVDIVRFEMVCPTCGTRDTGFGREEAKRLGREAARSIFHGAASAWSEGLLEELARLDPSFVKHAVRLGLDASD